MYLKVPDRKENGKYIDVSEQEVADALGELMQEHRLTIDSALNHPCVEFPKGTPHAIYKKVQKHLQDAGFAAY